MIEKVIIENYRALKKTTIEFNEHLNIIVADNESGKSTILEAINLCLTGQLNGRFVQNELHPYLFNQETVLRYIQSLSTDSAEQPPKIFIEVYLKDRPELTKFKGSINSLRSNSCGLRFIIEFDEGYSSEYLEFIKKPHSVRNIPIEYYKITWQSFAYDNLTARGVPVDVTLIDASSIRHNVGANKYILDIVKNYLTEEQRVQLSLSYRKIKDLFLQDENVSKINQKLSETEESISSKQISVSLDSSSKSNWEYGIETQLNNIPLALSGRGEQNSIKIKLAMRSSEGADVFLIEEPENHLSHSNLNSLIRQISERADGKQLVITTHSSFVLNKLGIDNVILFTQDQNGIRLKDLSPDTHDYFVKLPGHNTLRLILAKNAILVEGPSDELIVFKSFQMKYSCSPLEKNTDVISVQSLAFKRFLEIAKPLKIRTTVITDNDGDIESLQKKYVEYSALDFIKISYDTDVSCVTLEDQILKSNSLSGLNKIFGKDFSSNDELLKFMKSNKADCALKIFNTTESFTVPSYIYDSI